MTKSEYIRNIMFAKTFGCCRKFYNMMLADKIKSYEETKALWKQTLTTYQKTIRFEVPLKEVDSLSFENVQIIDKKGSRFCYKDIGRLCVWRIKIFCLNSIKILYNNRIVYIIKKSGRYFINRL